MRKDVVETKPGKFLLVLAGYKFGWKFRANFITQRFLMVVIMLIFVAGK